MIDALNINDVFPPEFWSDMVAEALAEGELTPAQIEIACKFMSDPDLRNLLPDLAALVEGVDDVVRTAQGAVRAVVQKA